MNLAELRARLLEWLEEFKPFGSQTQQSWGDYIVQTGDEGYESLLLTFYTNDHEYHVHCAWDHVHCAENQGKGYMGGFVQTRKPRAGETWQRGNDLHDGPFSRETLRQIFLDAIRYEMVAKVKSNRYAGQPVSSVEAREK